MRRYECGGPGAASLGGAAARIPRFQMAFHPDAAWKRARRWTPPSSGTEPSTARAAQMIPHRPAELRRRRAAAALRALPGRGARAAPRHRGAGRAFRLSFEQAAHRLSTLQRTARAACPSSSCAPTRRQCGQALLLRRGLPLRALRRLLPEMGGAPGLRRHGAGHGAGGATARRRHLPLLRACRGRAGPRAGGNRRPSMSSPMGCDIARARDVVLCGWARPAAGGGGHRPVLPAVRPHRLPQPRLPAAWSIAFAPTRRGKRRALPLRAAVRPGGRSSRPPAASLATRGLDPSGTHVAGAAEPAGTSHSAEGKRPRPMASRPLAHSPRRDGRRWGKRFPSGPATRTPAHDPQPAVAVQMDPIESINIDADSTFALMLEARPAATRCGNYHVRDHSRCAAAASPPGPGPSRSGARRATTSRWAARWSSISARMRMWC